MGRPAPGDGLAARARAALAARREELRDAEGAFVPTLSDADVAWALEALGARAKGELRATRDGRVPLHAAGSSTRLVASAFAGWRAFPQSLSVAGLRCFDDVRLEERILIPHGGGSPNLDVALERDGGGLVGIEAKLCEHLTATRPRPWKDAYRRPAMREELDPAWRAVFDDLLADEERAPRHLDAGQLIRHALSLRGAGELVYLFWEPLDGDEHPEVRAHREEVARLLDRVGRDASPGLRSVAWSETFAAWEADLPAHAAALQARYDVAVRRP